MAMLNEDFLYFQNSPSPDSIHHDYITPMADIFTVLHTLEKHIPVGG